MNSVILKNIGSNWAGMGVAVLVAFFMMPFVLMKLGTIGYGFWALLQSVFSFKVLLDLGLRSSLIRFLAKSYAENDGLLASQIFNVGLVIYSIIGGVITFISFGLGVYFPSLFDIASIDHQTVLFAVILVGASFGLYFPSAVFNAVLTGHQRYDLMNLAQIGNLLIRTVLIVFFLNRGYGIVSVALATLLGTIANLFLEIYFSKKIYPPLRIKFSHWDWSTVKLLGTHGIFSFILIGSRGILTNSGIVLVGAFIGPAAVTVYSIGVTLTTYATQIVNGITATLAPAASALDAKKSGQKLIDLSLNSAKLILITGYSILITYLISGDLFISLWLGDEYRVGYAPLILLSFCWAIFYLQSPFLGILTGLSRHKIPAFLMLGEVCLSISLGVALVQRDGMLGVAWGALFAGIITGISSLLYGLRVLEVSILTYLRRTLLPALLALIPFGCTLTMLPILYQPTGLLEYFSQVILSLLIMGCFLPWLGLDSQEREKILNFSYVVFEPYLSKRFIKK